MKIATSSWLFMGVLSLLMAFTSLSTDIYLPAMPAMSHELHGNVEYTITGYLLGFAIAQVFWGPFSDKYGRRLPLALGMILFVIGSAGCAWSTDMNQIVFWRVIQAFGGCVAPMLSRAMVRDLFGRTKAAEMLSTLAIIMAIAPIGGPIMGGYMVNLWDWQSIFWFLTGVGIFMFLALYFVPETLGPDKRSQRSLLETFKNYKVLVKNGQYMKYTLCITFYYMSLYVFLTASPQVYIDYFHINPAHFGYLFGLNIIGVVIMSAFNRRLVRVFPLEKMVQIATAFSTCAIIATFILLLLGYEWISIVVVGVFFFFTCNGLIAANTNAIALDRAGSMAGSGAALLGSLQYGSGIVSSIVLALSGGRTPLIMVGLMVLFTVISMAFVVKVKTHYHHEEA